MRISLFALLFVATLFSCQREEGLLPLEAQSPVQNTVASSALPNDIVSSEWWNSLGPLEQKLTAGELNRSGALISLRQIEERRMAAQSELKRLGRGRVNVCAGGFPANPAGDVTLNSQADVDAFGAWKCKDIIGAMTVSDTRGPDPICDLSPLSKLQTIGSSLTINVSCASSLAGLNKLKSIGELGPFGFIGVSGDNLTDIEALSKLKVLTGSLNIISNPQLTGFSQAFRKITVIDSTLNNNSVFTFSLININENALLTDISGLRNVASIAGGLRIINNASIIDLDDLSSLTQINQDIFVYENLSLQQVDVLSVITSISDDLAVFDNPSLNSCCGLYSLLCNNPPSCTNNGVGDLLIVENNGCSLADILAGGACSP